jgi:hypothetical protein
VSLHLTSSINSGGTDIDSANLIPIATCSPKNSEQVKSYGAEETFDYHEQDCATRIVSLVVQLNQIDRNLILMPILIKLTNLALVLRLSELIQRITYVMPLTVLPRLNLPPSVLLRWAALAANMSP